MQPSLKPKARPYLSSDYDQVRSWLEKQKAHVFHPDVLPPVGAIVDGVAAYFLYETIGSPYCYMENLVTNPDASPESRHFGILAVTEAIVKEGKKRGFKFAMAVTDVPSVITRAVTMGAKTEKAKILLTLQLY